LLEEIRECLLLLPPRLRWKWALLVPLVVAAAAMELLSAAAIFWLVTILQSDGSTLPATVPTWLAKTSFGDESSSVVAVILIGLAGLFIFKNALLAWTTVAQSMLVNRSMASIFDRLATRLLRAPYRLHPTRNSSEIVHAAFHGVDQAFRMVLSPAVSLIAELFLLSGLCGVLLWLTPWASVLVAIVLGGTTAILIAAMRRPVLRWGRENHERGRELIGRIAELLAGQREIRTMLREREFHRRTFATFEVWDRAHYRHTVAAAMPRLVIETVFILSALVIFAVTRSTATGADLIPIAALFAYAGFRVIPGANRIAFEIDLIRHGKPSVDQLSGLMKTFEADDAEEWPSVVRPDMPEPRACRVDVDHVTYSHGRGEPPVLDDVSVRIAEGESLGIVGETGSGKSTMIDLIAGLLTPDSGTITIDGGSIRTWQIAGGRLGYVPQVGFLLDDSILANIVMGDAIDRNRVDEAVDVARLRPFLESLPDGLDAVVGERGVRISGGERQRIALARVLYFDPDLLLLDEATSALDYRTEIALGNAMARQRRNRTTIIVAHRLETVRECDQIIVLNEGRIVGNGTWDDLEHHCDAFRRLLRGETAGVEAEPADR